jgi:cytochrome c oxidase subunit II
VATEQIPRRPLRSRVRRKWLLALAIGAPLLLASCQIPTFGAHPGDSTQGQSAFKLWQGFFIAGLIVGGIVLALILWAVFRFRRTTDAIPRQTQYHTVFEIFYTIVPIIVVVILFVFTVITENSVDATPANHPVIVDVTAFQWGWQFTYPGQNVTIIGETTEAPQMVIPTGQNVQIELRSKDVIHGFYVPQFNFSRYALPGVLNQFDINVPHPGVFRGQCTQFCGLYHSLMLFSVKAVTPDQYQAWLAQEQGTASLTAANSTQRTSGVTNS